MKLDYFVFIVFLYERGAISLKALCEYVNVQYSRVWRTSINEKMTLWEASSHSLSTKTSRVQEEEENKQLIAELDHRNVLIKEYMIFTVLFLFGFLKNIRSANKIIGSLDVLQMQKQHNEINCLAQICKYQYAELKINNLDNMDVHLPKNLEKSALEKVYKVGL